MSEPPPPPQPIASASNSIAVASPPVPAASADANSSGDRKSAATKAATGAGTAAANQSIMLWTREEARFKQKAQDYLGPSSCAAAAALTALTCLKVSFDTAAAVDPESGFRFNKRRCSCHWSVQKDECKLSIRDHLIGRSVAGMTSFRIDRFKQCIQPGFLATLKRVTADDPVSAFFVPGTLLAAHPRGPEFVIRHILSAGGVCVLSQNCQIRDELPLAAFQPPPSYVREGEAPAPAAAVTVTDAKSVAFASEVPIATSTATAAAAATDAKSKPKAPESASTPAATKAAPQHWAFTRVSDHLPELLTVSTYMEDSIADFWHAQMIFGMDESNEVWLTNPIERVPLSQLIPKLITPCCLLVRTAEALHHMRDMTDAHIASMDWSASGDDAAEWDSPAFRVSEQILAARELQRRCRAMSKSKSAAALDTQHDAAADSAAVLQSGDVPTDRLMWRRTFIRIPYAGHGGVTVYHRASHPIVIPKS